MPKLERRRYLALKIQSEQLLDEKKVMAAVLASVNQLFGEYGASQANLKLIKHNSERNQLVIRCSHKMLEKVRAAIAAITEINEKTATIQVIGVSGTIKALSKKT